LNYGVLSALISSVQHFPLEIPEPGDMERMEEELSDLLDGAVFTLMSLSDSITRLFFTHTPPAKFMRFSALGSSVATSAATTPSVSAEVNP